MAHWCNHQTGFKQSSRRDSLLQYKAPSLASLASLWHFWAYVQVTYSEQPTVFTAKGNARAKKDLCIESILRLPTSVHIAAIFKEFSRLQHINYWMYNPGICNHTGWLLSVKNAAQKRQTIPAHRYGYWLKHVCTYFLNLVRSISVSVSSWRH